MYKLLCVAIAMMALSCSKSDMDQVIGKPKPGISYTDFLIPAGSHAANGNNIKGVTGAYLHFAALFDSSAIYTSKTQVNQYDINKLYGFSDCGSAHHQNSARVGWLWNGATIELHAYCYAAGVRSSELMGTLQIGEPAEITIRVQKQQYVFEWKGKQTLMKRNCSSDRIEGYQLYPYFGGDEVAPHDVHVYVKELN